MPSRHVARITAFGAVAEIACPDRGLWEECSASLPGHWVESPAASADVRFAIVAQAGAPAGERRFHFSENGKPLIEAITAQEMRAVLGSRIDYHLGAHARDCAFLHCGVVVYEGNAILMPGKSRAGKSTLTAALVRAGAHYVSDDVAVIDAGGRAHFLNRAIALRDDVARAFDMPLDAALSQGSAPVGTILFLNYREGSPELELLPLGRAAAAMHLVANAMNGRRQPQTVIACCAAAVHNADCFEGMRADAGAAATQILTMTCAREKQA